MAKHPEKLDQDTQARQPHDTHSPHQGERIRDQHPPRGHAAGDEEE